jgi:phosphomannomutase
LNGLRELDCKEGVFADMTAERELIVSVSGVRGIVGQGLTPAVATAFGAALGTLTRGGTVVLSRDGRPSGQMLRHAVLAGLVATGCHVQDLGVAPTPTVGLAVRRLQAAGGIQITASHNPAPWNGLKLFGRDGRVLPASQGRQVQALFEAGTFRYVSWHELGAASDCPDAADWHREKVLELVDAPAIRATRLKVFLDANGGAGGPLGKSLLEAFHCPTVAVGCEADGIFDHEPEPLAENLKSITPRVAAAQAAVGFVLDPDADRLALIDETGRYIGEELTLALAVLFRLRQQPGPVVINMSTSRVIEDLCQRFGVECHRAAVGEANVADRMVEVGAVIGGEGNGGVIDPRVGLVRDPFIGMGLILNLLAESGKRLSELVAELPSYCIVKTKCQVERARLSGLLNGLKHHWPEARDNGLDGLRLDWPDRWLHVRPSNTEPIVRIIAEAPTAGAAEQMCREAAQVLAG